MQAGTTPWFSNDGSPFAKKEPGVKGSTRLRWIQTIGTSNYFDTEPGQRLEVRGVSKSGKSWLLSNGLYADKRDEGKTWRWIADRPEFIAIDDDLEISTSPQRREVTPKIFLTKNEVQRTPSANVSETIQFYLCGIHHKIMI